MCFLFVADVPTAFDYRAISNHSAELRLIKHLAIDDAAILKGEMDKCPVLCRRLRLARIDASAGAFDSSPAHVTTTQRLLLRTQTFRLPVAGVGHPGLSRVMKYEQHRASRVRTDAGQAHWWPRRYETALTRP